MIKLRPQHIQLFDELAERLFVKRMVEHVQYNFTSQCEGKTPDAIRERVIAQIEKAKTHHITSKQDICDFIGLCFLFGDKLGEDYQTAWASKILNDEKLHYDGGLMMAKLNQEASKHLPID